MYRKLMTMYQDTFGFRTPFQILCDASFCLEGTRSGLLTLGNTAKLMDKLVQGQSTLSKYTPGWARLESTSSDRDVVTSGQ